MEDALAAPKDSFAETNCLEDLEGWDSIGILAVIAVIDEHYGVTPGAEAIANCRTLGDLALLVEADGRPT
jgi:acyl carrier protein